MGDTLAHGEWQNIEVRYSKMNGVADWSLWRTFAAVVEHGSLSGAGRALGISQPTIGRHVEMLEAQLGLSLFERTLSGLKPNTDALRLYEPVKQAQASLAQAAILAQGAQSQAGGTVRITASTIISNYVLPAILARVRERHPAIALEIVPSDSAENLLMREADIALRMFRPTQLELVTRHLGDIAIVPVAHERYLARRGRPTTLDELLSHELIGLDRSDAIIDHVRKLGHAISRDNFPLRSDDQTHLWELVKAGLGIGFGQQNLANATPGLVALPIDIKVPALPLWLTTHRELFTSHRIRVIYDAVAEGLGDYIRDSSSSPGSR
ncbi:MAG: LysR family transcriptional regulator [Devosia sp.]|uniref:LysR family transcriptional regulator n=1 Tax=Devosia sp. TaxID=1871048 RepID=UPI0019E91A17|nr:LysR family transcriptional regulator [Devosia sp.]MBF0679101.1 LysR family transcriptional regulator [Devosia sp.]